MNEGKKAVEGPKAGSTGRNRRGSGRVLPLPLAIRLPVIGAPLTPIPEVPEGNQGEPAGLLIDLCALPILGTMKQSFTAHPTWLLLSFH